MRVGGSSHCSFASSCFRRYYLRRFEPLSTRLTATTSTSLSRWTAIRHSCSLLVTLDLQFVVSRALLSVCQTGTQPAMIALRVAILSAAWRADVDQPVVDPCGVLTGVGILALGCLWERAVAVSRPMLAERDVRSLRKPLRRFAPGG